MIQIRQFGVLSAVLAAGVLGTAALAAPPEAADAAASAAAAVAAAQADPVFEPARQSVHATTVWLARGVDSWFGDKPFSDGGKITDGRLSLFVLKRQGESPDVSLRFNARAWLPNLQDRAYLFLGRDDSRETVTDKPEALTRQQRLLKEGTADPSFFAGLGFALHDAVQFRIGFHGGLKPYAHARFSQAWPLGGADRVDFRETLFWTPDDRIGSTTALSYEHAQSSTLVLRWLNAATITQDSKKFEWSSILGAYRSYGNQQLLTLEALGSGLQGAGVPVTDIGVQVKWEQPVHKDWLLGEILVGHFWPRPDAQTERTRAWALGAGLKMKF